MNNAVYLVLFAAVVGFFWYKFGLEGVWSAAKMLVGLGFVIFIHELGHFLAAKWCDVHVQTFSIGFGPALPGCSFQRGETTYKIGALPLGGYVNMVGEGPEADEDENYPRSFKNKTVGQRMLIISAGVVMNVLLGCVLFIVVYYYHGVLAPPAVVGQVDAGSPMWTKGIPTGALITNLDGVESPTFDNLRRKVVLSSSGQVLPFTIRTFGPEGEKERTVDLLPRREANDLNPVVGVSPPEQLRLEPRPRKDFGYRPVVLHSAAAAARPIPVEAGEVLVAATDPDNPERVTPLRHDLAEGTFDYADLARRLGALEGKAMVVHVLPRGADAAAKPAVREVPPEGFQFNDRIVGCTEEQDARTSTYNPFRVGELPRDRRHESGDQRDPFVFRSRMRRFAGRPVVIQVRRGDPHNTSLRADLPDGPTVNLFVPPASHVTFGLRMKMGKVAGVRDDSPAARAGVQKGDELIKVVLTDAHGKELYASGDLDPVRLPFELGRAASSAPGEKKVRLTVRREPSDSDHRPRDVACPAVEWDERWDDDQEAAAGAGSPLPIPQLGVAYWVLSQVVEVKAGSPAAAAGLRKDDTLKEFRIKRLSQYQKEPAWSDWFPLETKRDDSTVYDRWAHAFAVMQVNDYREVQFRVSRPGEEVKEPVTLNGEEDPTWPAADRGLHLQPDYTLQKADTLGQALVMGVRECRDMIVLMYQQLRSLLTGRVSAKQLAGPIGMGVQGFLVAQTGNFELLLFLAIISINLAVVNFLPIPILDGGHMVFLLYEKLRGRPPTEKVRAVATYVGLAVIGFLMIFVFYQDIQNYILKQFRG